MIALWDKAAACNRDISLFKAISALLQYSPSEWRQAFVSYIDNPTLLLALIPTQPPSELKSGLHNEFEAETKSLFENFANSKTISGVTSYSEVLNRLLTTQLVGETQCRELSIQFLSQDLLTEDPLLSSKMQKLLEAVAPLFEAQLSELLAHFLYKFGWKTRTDAL